MSNDIKIFIWSWILMSAFMVFFGGQLYSHDIEGIGFWMVIVGGLMACLIGLLLVIVMIDEKIRGE